MSEPEYLVWASPETHLAAEVLKLALRDLRSSRNWRCAEKFFEKDSSRLWFWCGLLKLEPSAVRRVAAERMRKAAEKSCLSSQKNRELDQVNKR